MKHTSCLILAFFFCFQLRGESFLPYSQETIKKLRDFITNPHTDLSYHKERFLLFSDLLIGPPPVYDELPREDEKKHFVVKKMAIQWGHDEARIPCNVVQYIKESHDYLFERYRYLRERALSQIDSLHEADSLSWNGKFTEYQKILQEIEQILNLVERSYPVEFQRPDRLVTYTLNYSEEFKEIMKEKDFRPEGEIKIFKIKFSYGNWIPLNGEIKGYMNFKSNASILKSLGYIENKNDKLHFIIQIEREVSPLEACLTDLYFEIIGHTGKVPKEKYSPLNALVISSLPPIIRHPEKYPISPGIFPFPIRNPEWTDPSPPYLWRE